jgi:hypothetical protein
MYESTYFRVIGLQAKMEENTSNHNWRLKKRLKLFLKNKEMQQRKKLFLRFLLFAISLQTVHAQTTTLVSIGANSKLIYTADAKGNTVPDFSAVGYQNGEVPIPTVAVVKTIMAISGDNRVSVQTAIDQVAAMPLDANGFRGAILFKTGTYNISDVISITASGIILRGEGFNGSGTNVIATKTAQHTLFDFAGVSGTTKVTSTAKNITDTYLPFGKKQVTVASGHSFVVGDKVYVHRSPNTAWIVLLKMDILTNYDPLATNWTASSYGMYSDRKVTAVSGNVLTLDAPIMDVIDPTYSTGEVLKYTDARIEKCGIENMRISSVYASATDENHAWEAVSFGNTINSWAKDVEAYYFGYSAVHVLSTSSWITVDNCKMLDAKSIIDGSHRYSFNVDGQRCLVQDCVARNGRHDFVTGSRTCGPNVFYNCSATLQQNDIGPHHRWATGLLFDNVTGNGDMNVQNRLILGSGHGWSGGQVMYWNCNAAKMIIQDPEGDATNWAIGCIAPTITGVGDAITEPIGVVQSTGTHIVAIPSLFQKQLSDHLTAILSVELLKFEAKSTGKTVLLTWSTASEKNNAVFHIEHSVNGQDFQTIGQVKGSGTSSVQVNYHFEHTDPSVNANYYRLKQVSFDEKTAFSDIRSVLFGKNGLFIKTTLVKDVLDVAVDVATTITIFNAAGQQVFTTKAQGEQRLNISTLPAGLYIIQTEKGGVGRFVKQ